MVAVQCVAYRQISKSSFSESLALGIAHPVGFLL